MSKNIELNKQLAELLGWTEIVELSGTLLGKPPEGISSCRDQAQVPDWCGSWEACGPLMTQYLLLTPIADKQTSADPFKIDCKLVFLNNKCGIDMFSVKDKDALIRKCLVKNTINFLRK